MSNFSVLADPNVLTSPCRNCSELIYSYKKSPSRHQAGWWFHAHNFIQHCDNGRIAEPQVLIEEDPW